MPDQDTRKVLVNADALAKLLVQTYSFGTPPELGVKWVDDGCGVARKLVSSDV